MLPDLRRRRRAGLEPDAVGLALAAARPPPRPPTFHDQGRSAGGGNYEPRCCAGTRGRGSLELVFDSLTIARRLTDAGLEREQADVLADAIRQAAEHGEHVTPDALRAELATLRADLYRAMLLQTVAIIGAGIAVLRLLG